MISACETEDGVVFDMSELEADALRSYADGLVADPKHPFVELLRSQGLVVGDTPVPHLAVLLEAFSQAVVGVGYRLRAAARDLCRTERLGGTLRRGDCADGGTGGAL